MEFFGLCASEIGGICMMKKYSISDKNHHLLVALIFYSLMIYLLYRLFKNGKTLLHLNVMWQVTVIVLGSVAAYFLYNERFDNKIQYLGILFAILAIICINTTTGSIKENKQ